MEYKGQDEQIKSRTSEKQYREMPNVHIDAEDVELSKKAHTFSFKIIVIFMVCIFIAMILFSGYKMIFKQEVNYQSNYTPDVSETNKDDKLSVPTVSKDTTKPEFIAFDDKLVVNLNAVDVDYTKYYLAIDEGKQVKISVEGDVDLSTEGEYPIQVIATDEAGNETIKDAVVQVVSEDTMVMLPVELSCMLDGSVPMAYDTKQRVDAGVINYYYAEVTEEMKSALEQYDIDVSNYRLDTYWNPSDLAMIVQ